MRGFFITDYMRMMVAKGTKHNKRIKNEQEKDI